MKKYLTLLLLFASCVSEEFETPPFESRPTVRILEDVEMTLGQYHSERDSFYITLKEAGSDTLLSPVDTTLVSRLVHENVLISGVLPFTGSITNFIEFNPYYYDLSGMKVLVSGEVKQKVIQDSIPGLPLILSKIDIIPNCPVPFIWENKEVPLQNTIWQWIGFVDESNQIYSVPTCENPAPSITLTDLLINRPESHYYSYQRDALQINFNQFYTGYFAVYTIKGSTLQIYTGFKKVQLSPGQQNAGKVSTYFSKYYQAKNDSLSLLFSKDFVAPLEMDFLLEGNQLILSNSKSKIRALFIAD
ncbi:hypothetical protein [Algoriphagus terrigena]|uniref:hypothetical protein n=1 Tax=Algoriphagus terrigena TaxID=344884 RepID=UPI0004002972|nr:hypothetical protein [Algoriphagus terrigena]